MVAERVATARAGAAKPTRNGKRARVVIDKRFALGRRVQQLTATFRARLGPEAARDLLVLTATERAAVLQTLAEQAAVRALRGDTRVTYDDIVRLARLADISVRRLRLDQRSAKQQPTLADYLRSRSTSESAP
jgi:hypothetical protein